MATPKAEYESCSDDAPLPQRRREASDSDISDDGLPVRKDPRGRTWYEDEFEGQGRAPESDDEFEVQSRVPESRDDDVVKVVNQKDNQRGKKQHMSSLGSLKGQSFIGESRGFISTNPTAERYGIRTGSPYTGDAQFKGNQRRARLSSSFEKMNLKDEGGLASQVRFQGHRSGYGRGNGSEKNHNQNNYDRGDNALNNYRRNYDQNNDQTYYNRSNYDSSNGPNYNLKNDQSYYKDRRNYGKSSDLNYALNNDQRYFNHRRNYGKSSNPNYALNDDKSYNDQKNYGKSNGPNSYDRSNSPRNYDRVDYGSSNYERNNFYNRKNARSSARGKGQMRCIPSRNKSNELPINQYNQSGVPDPMSEGEPYASNVQPDPVHPLKNAVTSNLNPTAPPYYSGVPSLIGPNITGTHCGTFMDEITNFDIVGNSNTNLQVQSLGRWVNMNTNDPVVVGNSDINPQVQQLGCWENMNTTAPLGRWLNMDTNDTVVVGNSDINSQVQQLGCWVDMNTTEPISQSELQASSLHQAPTLDSYGLEDLNKFRTLRIENEKEPEMGTIMRKSQIECPLCSNKSKAPFVEKKNAGIPEWQRDTYVYNGALHGTVGVLDLAQGDRGSLGVPTVDKVLPDKVDHSQHGFGNSWQPMLAGSFSAIGTSNCSPDVGLGYSVQTSSVSSIDGSSASLATTGNPPQSQKL